MDLSPAVWPQLSKLLDEALDMAPDARQEWLEQLATTQPRLAPSLRELLAAHASSETADVMAHLPPLSARAQMARTAVLAPGDRVGPYRLKREFGAGGMADVWLAERADGAFARDVALKLPLITRLRRDLAQRFARERDILARLEHPSIARLYDAGVSPDGLPYLAMEYVDGQPITEYCDQHQLDIESRLKLFTHVLEAVQFAHANLIIHRDLKPSNVLVTADAQVRLLDFGIAKLLADDETARETQLTQLSGRALTPDYASPEQIKGEPLTIATDVYSLGVVLYELLVGNRPYKLKVNTPAQLEQAIVSVDPARPSVSIANDAAYARKTTSKALRRSLAGDLDSIVLKALQKQVHQRYLAIDSFASDIERHRHGLTIKARPDTLIYRLSKFTHRHRIPISLTLSVIGVFALAIGVGATAVVAVALLVGFAIALWYARRATQQRDRALALLDRNEAMTEFLTMLIAQAARSRGAVADELLEKTEKLVDREFKDSPEPRAAVLGMMGITFNTLGNSSKAEALLKKALAAMRGSHDQALLDTLICKHAMIIAWMGRTADATEALKQIVERRTPPPENPAEALHYLAMVSGRANDPQSALVYATDALRALRKARRTSPNKEASYLATLGTVCSGNGRNHEADRYFEAAMDKLATLGRERGANAVLVRSNWAAACDNAGNPRQALKLLDEALSITMEDTPDSSPNAHVVAYRARVLEFLGRLVEAQAVYQQGLELAQAVGNTAQQINCRLGIASVLHASGRIDEAERYAREADLCATVAQSPQSTDAGLLYRAIVRGRIALSRQRLAEAKQAFTDAMGDRPSIPRTVMALLGRSEVNLCTDDAVAALDDARDALKLAQTLQSRNTFSNRTGLAWLALGNVLQKRADATGARHAYAQAVEHLSQTVDADHPAAQRARLLLAMSKQTVSQ